MSNPPPDPGYPPTAYPNVPQKRGASCWAIGGIGCLVIFILGVILIFLMIRNAAKSPAFRTLMQSVSQSAQSSQAAAACIGPMQEIQKAIVRYHEHEGKYPDNLKQLTTKYLPNGVTLHCGIDTNDDPAHVTYEYIKPTEKSPSSAVVMRYSWPITISFAGQSQTEITTEQISLGGNVSQAQTRTIVAPAGGLPTTPGR